MSYWFDRKVFPAAYRIDGHASFDVDFVTPFLRPGATVVDVGGGKHPTLSPARKAALNLTVIGVDISQAELDAAPSGSYDSTLCADVMKFTGDGSADLAICSAVLEHIADVESALRGIASMLRSEGVALLFIPCRNSLSAQLNLCLPQSFKRKLLNWLFPEMRGVVGFPAYYDRCTPHQIESLALQNGLVPEKVTFYFSSGYFTVFLPAHIFWRLYQALSRLFIGTEAAENFSVAMRKR
jgi:2-polyprenyl-6-hydroxyphenyl methylase/3-demethylubiquinone-9 3-methyltransferase